MVLDVSVMRVLLGCLAFPLFASVAQGFTLSDAWRHPQRSDYQRQYVLETQRRPRAGFVALGDSYSAGIGTGTDGPENDCRQGIHAYPALIAKDLAASQGGRNSTSFQFLSCTGATTKELLPRNPESQMDALNGSLPVDFALLSVGGNDLGFFEVMNACVFRFYNFYSGTCETALQNTQDRLNEVEFETRLRMVILELLNKIKWEKKPVGHLENPTSTQTRDKHTNTFLPD
jgi:lysophospholipase L1-like esterase